MQHESMRAFVLAVLVAAAGADAVAGVADVLEAVVGGGSQGIAHATAVVVAVLPVVLWDPNSRAEREVQQP